MKKPSPKNTDAEVASRLEGLFEQVPLDRTEIEETLREAGIDAKSATERMMARVMEVQENERRERLAQADARWNEAEDAWRARNEDAGVRVTGLGHSFGALQALEGIDLAARPDERFTLSELARGCDLNKATAHALLTELTGRPTIEPSPAKPDVEPQRSGGFFSRLLRKSK